jgi:hypothetical protein
MSYMEEMYDASREYIYKHIDMYQKNYMDELAVLLSISDETYEKWLTEVRDWEDEMLLFLDEEQIDGFLPLQDKIDKKLQETFMHYIIRSDENETHETWEDTQASYDDDWYYDEYGEDEYDDDDEWDI